MNEFEQAVTQSAAQLGAEVPPQVLDAFAQYKDFLCLRNSVTNLTAVQGDADMAKRHFADSIALTRCFDFSGKSIIDVGSGAGFPGLPVKLYVPSAELTMLDSLQKRVDFLSELCSRLGVSARCVHARAEEQALLAGWRDSFDAAVSRAVARLNMLCELCLPFVRPGGVFLAMKAADADEEISEAAGAIAALGARLDRIFTYSIDGVNRSVAVIEKIRPTPGEYPRRYAKIQKKPL